MGYALINYNDRKSNSGVTVRKMRKLLKAQKIEYKETEIGEHPYYFDMHMHLFEWGSKS